MFDAAASKKREILERHQRMAMDPLERALHRVKREEASEKKVRGLLEKHLVQMMDSGLAFEHEFLSQKLGFKIVVARYGEHGRRFIQVEEVMEHCEVAKRLKVKDELISVDDCVLAEPDEKAFEELKAKIASSPRPLKLAFIEGENHVDEHDLEDSIFDLAVESDERARSAERALQQAKDAEAGRKSRAEAADEAESHAQRALEIAETSEKKLASAEANEARYEILPACEKIKANAAQAATCAKMARNIAHGLDETSKDLHTILDEQHDASQASPESSTSSRKAVIGAIGATAFVGTAVYLAAAS